MRLTWVLTVANAAIAIGAVAVLGSVAAYVVTT
jgi:hypothetical protein